MFFFEIFIVKKLRNFPALLGNPEVNRGMPENDSRQDTGTGRYRITPVAEESELSKIGDNPSTSSRTFGYASRGINLFAHPYT